MFLPDRVPFYIRQTLMAERIPDERLIGWAMVAESAFGISLYVLLSARPSITESKLLNVFGLTVDLLSIALLSKLILEASSKHKAIFDFVYASILTSFFCIPIGILLSHLMLFWLDYPSAAPVFRIAGHLLSYVFLPLFFTDYLGEVLRLGFYRGTSQRVAFMGWYLLIAGILLQLWGAVLDLLGR